MIRNFRILLAIAVLAVSVLACGTPTVPTAEPVPATQAAVPVENVQPTAIPTAVPEEVTAADGDLANAVLTVADLPAGFEELSADDLKTMGLDQDSLGATFKESLKNAEPQSFKAFMNLQNFEMVLSFVLAPLTLLERASFDVYLANPDGAAKDFAAGAGSGDVKIIEGMNNIGDSSVGLTFDSGEGASALRIDVAISRRGSAVVVNMVFYKQGETPVITIQQVADIMDQRVEAALK